MIEKHLATYGFHSAEGELTSELLTKFLTNILVVFLQGILLVSQLCDLLLQNDLLLSRGTNGSLEILDLLL